MMKKLLFTAWALFAFTLIACDKQDEQPVRPAPEGTEPLVCLTFESNVPPSSKAFFDPVASAESWEKSLSSVSILIFSPDGTLVLQRNFDPEELTARSATFALPNALAGQSCEFYAVANRPLTGIASRSQLLTLLEENAGEYNGLFGEVSAGGKRSGGFVMTAHATATVAPAGNRTDLALTLKRTVAKIAVQAAPTALFASRYSGKVRINSAVLSRAASQGLLVDQAAPATGAMTYSHTQPTVEAAGKFNNLFYVFENGTLAEGSRVLLTLNATYDQDGNFTTLADQAEVTYQVELTGGGAGQLARNGYYRVQVGLDGLTGSDATVTVSVADWEPPVTQQVDLGA